MSTTWLPVLAAPLTGALCAVVIARLSPAASDATTNQGSGRPGIVVPGGWLGPAVIAAAMLVAVLSCLWAPDATHAWRDSGLGWTLLTLAWIDFRCQLLPDCLTLPLLLAGLAMTGVQDMEDLPDHALAAACGYGAIAGLAAVYRRWRGHEGIGLGDAKLLAAGGAWVGLDALPWVLAVSALCGIAAGLARGARFGDEARAPFGPWLALAIWVFR